MAKFNFYLRDKNATTETPVFLMVRYNNETLKYSTGILVNPKLWDSNSKSIKCKKDDNVSREKSLSLANLLNDSQNAYARFINENNRQPTKKEFKVAIDKFRGFGPIEKDRLSLVEYIDRFMEESAFRQNDKTGKPITRATINTYNQVRTNLSNFEKHERRKIYFSDADLDFYLDFHKYMLSVGLATNTIGKRIAILKTILKDATDRGYNTNMAFKSPRFKVTREKSESIYLNNSEIMDIYNLDLSENKRLENVRDLFVIGCFTGLRFSDLSKLTTKNIVDGYIEIETQKTRESVSIPVHRVVELILNKYDGKLPSAISNQKTNEYLKEIGKMVESLQKKESKKITKGGHEIQRMYNKYELITTHTARRSFASNLFLTGKMPIQSIMRITGHKTEKSFMEYIKITPRESANILKKIWEDEPLMFVKGV